MGCNGPYHAGLWHWLTIWIQSCLSPKLVVPTRPENQVWPTILSIPGGGQLMNLCLFLEHYVKWMQIAPAKIWICFDNSIFFAENHSTTYIVSICCYYDWLKYFTSLSSSKCAYSLNSLNCLLLICHCSW